VLRGGAWNNNWNNARCAYRNNNHPDNRNNNVGLRVVVAHDSWPMPEILRVYGWADAAKESWSATLLAVLLFIGKRANIE
jgi:hypothetical protein